MHQQIVINGSNIHDLKSFYAEVNRVFMSNETWEIGESLDAFNDLLYGGFGILQNNKLAKIIWLDIEKSRTALGYDATRSYYLAKLQPDSPFNKQYFREKLDELEHRNGQTFFDIVMEIISEHPNIELSR
jgi:RNAse (barnase) inhibitor barstar